MERLTEDWLRTNGFKWHQLDRQPHKHWLLWLGATTRDGLFASIGDLGIEVTPAWWRNARGEQVGDLKWHCWLRADASARYSRFLHVRYLRTVDELLLLVEAISGQKWDPRNCLYGHLYPPAQAARLRAEDERRLDRQMLRDGHPWAETERDDSRGGALPEHLEAYAKERGQ